MKNKVSIIYLLLNELKFNVIKIVTSNLLLLLLYSYGMKKHISQDDLTDYLFFFIRGCNLQYVYFI